MLSPALRRRFTLALVITAFVPALPSLAADAEEPPPKLLGRCSVEELEQPPFAEWFRSGYDDYVPDAEIAGRLRGLDPDGVRLTVFFGTWCGDSRREVPRLLKLLDTIGFPRERVELIAVDSTDEAVKRSPGGEERGLEIYRVPTVVVRRGELEVARIVEYPVRSLERDLLTILEGRPYEPSYATYAVICRWLGEGLLADPNVSEYGLADEIRHRITTEGELSAAARVLLSRGDTVEALALYRVNCVLHRDSPGCFARLAGALSRSGERDEAVAAAEKALRLGPDPEETKELVELIRESAE